MTKKIEELQIDGDLLLLLTEKNLQQDLGVNNAITRKRFYCCSSHFVVDVLTIDSHISSKSVEKTFLAI